MPAALPNEKAMTNAFVSPRFVRVYPPAAPPPGTLFYLPFQKNDLVLTDTGNLLTHPSEGSENGLYSGLLDGVPCVAYRLSDGAELPPNSQTVGLRGLYGLLGDDEYTLAGYALQLLHFHETYRHCSRCGTLTHNLPGSWGQECPQCGHSVYPPVSPAVLALVHDGGDRILLAQKAGWGKRYSILAGFVEPGESMEGCVVREVFEEAGVRVVSPTYHGSQPWPFPHQVMVGFTARWVSGEIVIDETELSHAAWFRWDALPELPPPLSLSRQLIDAWVAERRAAS